LIKHIKNTDINTNDQKTTVDSGDKFICMYDSRDRPCVLYVSQRTAS